MDPTPPPDDSGRPARPQDDAEDLEVAEDRAADDGWATEGEPGASEAEQTTAGEPSAVDPEQTAEAGPPAEASSSDSGTETWRGPEATGRTPASIEPALTAEAPATIEADQSADTAEQRADSAALAASSASDGSTSSDGATSDWRGPEAAGRTPASIEPPRDAEPAASIEPASSTESNPSDAGTADWRGPESTGWTPGENRLEPQEQRTPEATHEWPAADLRLPRSGDVEPSGETGLAEEPARSGRAPGGFSFFSRGRSDDDDSEEDADSSAAYAPPEHLRVEERPRRLPGRRAASAALVRADPAEICPFLVAAAGGWRLAVPSREHRCGAVSPPSPLSPQKQTRLCLTEGHLRCATFLAAGAARESRVGSAAMPERVSRWALARTTPVVEEVGGVRTTLAGMLADRRRWPAIPAMLLIVALATLGLSSLRGGGAVTALATPSPQPTDAAVPTVSIAPTATVAPTAEPSPTTAPTVAPTAAPTPAPTHATYTVVSGDTLGAIAKQFGTTVQAIMDLNGITDPGRLKIGQVLQIP